jgi:hypothetical protein
VKPNITIISSHRKAEDIQESKKTPGCSFCGAPKRTVAKSIFLPILGIFVILLMLGDRRDCRLG